MPDNTKRGLRELVGVYEDAPHLQEKEREYLRALGILAESPVPSKEEMEQLIKDYNRYLAHYEEKYGKKYSRSDGDVDPKKAYFHSLLGEHFNVKE